MTDACWCCLWAYMDDEEEEEEGEEITRP